MGKQQTISNGMKSYKTLIKRYGKDHMSEIGSKGGLAVVKYYGSEYMSLLAQLGWAETDKDATKIERKRQRILNT